MNIESIVNRSSKTKLSNKPIHFGFNSDFPKIDFLGVCEKDILHISKKCNLQVMFTPIGTFATGMNKEGCYVFLSSIGYHENKKPILCYQGKEHFGYDIFHEMGVKRPLEKTV